VSARVAERPMSSFAVTVVAVCAVAALTCVSGDCNAAETREQARTIVQALLRCWQSNDYNTFASLLDKDVLFAYPGGRLNRSQLLDVFKSYHREKKDIRVYFWEQFFLSGQKFFTAYQFAATDVKSGKRQAVGTGVAGEIKDGKIVLLKEYYDGEVALHQYDGTLPLDEGIVTPFVTPWPARVWLRPDLVN
jgi:ketosteroid isomerase-like protein